MTQDEMIGLAKQAGWQYAHGDSGFEPLWAFAALVAAAEREACAKLCEDEKINATHYSAPTQSNWLAKKIRAR
jgi:hypothetical protein